MGRVKTVKIVETMEGDLDKKEGMVKIVTDDEEVITISGLHWTKTKDYTPKDDVKVTINVTQTKLSDEGGK